MRDGEQALPYELQGRFKVIPGGAVITWHEIVVCGVVVGRVFRLREGRFVGEVGTNNLGAYSYADTQDEAVRFVLDQAGRGRP